MDVQLTDTSIIVDNFETLMVESRNVVRIT